MGGKQDEELGSDSVAMKLMTKMGFQGRLGKNEDGIASSVVVTVTERRKGLGCTATIDHTEQIPQVSTHKKRRRKRKPDPVDPESRKNDQSVYYKRQIEAHQAYHVQKCAQTSDTEGCQVVDSGRRGLLVDFDLLSNNWAERRIEAYMEIIGNEQWRTWAETELLELSDDSAARFILEATGNEVSEQAVDEMLASVDDLLHRKRLEANSGLIMGLRKVGSSPGWFVGLLHRGSRARMAFELAELGITATAIARHRATIGFGVNVPYTDRWHDLAGQMAVPLPQCIIVARGSSTRVSFGVLAANCLKTGLVLVSPNSSENDIPGAESAEDVVGMSHQQWESTLFDVALPTRRPEHIECRVLAQFANDGFWYAARTLYSSASGAWVRFAKYENECWIRKPDMRSLAQCEWDAMESAGFPGAPSMKGLE